MKIIRKIETNHPAVRCILLTAACIFAFSALSCDEGSDVLPMAQQPVDITFAVFGNTGIVTDGGKTFGEIAGAVNESGVDFSVDLGNRLPQGVSGDGMNALLDAVDRDREMFDSPVYSVAGRNDIFDYESDVAYSGRYGPLWYDFRRGGVHCIALNTEDETYRTGFGVSSTIRDEQLVWLEESLASAGSQPTVVFLHRPVWEENPGLWGSILRPLFRAGEVDLIISCSDEGLFDYGDVDGFRAVATGCTGPVADVGPGMFPHALHVTFTGDDLSFKVLLPDGTFHEGISVDRKMVDDLKAVTSALRLPVFNSDRGWNISESVRLYLDNKLDTPLMGTIDFSTYRGTSWNIEPSPLKFALGSGYKNSFHVTIAGQSPELGPSPEYRVKVVMDDRTVFESEDAVRVHIPQQRTGEPVPIDIGVAEIVPYDFTSPLRIPVEVDTYDICGRLIIYRDGESGASECIHISPLVNFKPGIHEFTWNGRDLSGGRIRPDSLVYKVFTYNKKAPATWIATGPPGNDGSFILETTLSGLRAVTHDDGSLYEYRIGASKGDPVASGLASYDDLLDGMVLRGFARGEDDRVYLGTDVGVASVIDRKNSVTPDAAFGNGGYAAFTEYRGRHIGIPAYAGGLLFVGVGGGEGQTSQIVILDDRSGETVGGIDLGRYFGELSLPPAVTSTEDGLYCAHPDSRTVVMMSHYGEVYWVSDRNSTIIATDTDGRSFTHVVGVDNDGFTYVNTPGYSSRCVVIGPDGTGLFRVILVSLPGLRVSSVVPLIEEKQTDGLYFVTRGGDIPYVFHVPFTVRSGLIVDEGTVLR